MLRRLLIASLALATGTLAAACGSSSGSSSGTTGAIASSLTIARPADIVTLNPRDATENESIWTDELLYSNLVVSTPNGKSVQPALATTWHTSAGGRRWAFSLRPGVTFSNGQPLTAQDVVFSLDLDRASSAPWAFTLGSVKNIAAVGTHTVEITLKYPYAPLLADLALFANSIVPANYDGKSPSAFYANPIGTGPYVLQRWIRGTSAVLTANPHWWGGKLAVRRLTFTDVPDDNSRVLQLEGGQANIIEAPPLSDTSSIDGRSGLHVSLYPSTYSRFLVMNEDRKPFADIHVRRAIWYALNRSALVKAILFGDGTVANSFFSSSMAYYSPTTPTLPYDLAKARAEMAQSSVPHGFSTSLVVASGDDTEDSLGQAIQGALAPLGIKVSLEPVNSSDEFTNYLAKGNFDLGLDYYTSDIPDPDEIVSFYVGANFLVGYHNPQVSSLATSAARDLNPSGRASAYAKFQNILAQDAIWVPLYYAPYAYAEGPNTKGFAVSALGAYILPGTEPPR